MKDEIKEMIPENVKFILDDIKSNILWNYITNLQEKYERMKENAEILSNGYNELEKRNEKAIEYINNNIEDEYEYHGLLYKNEEKQNLLNILNGDEK